MKKIFLIVLLLFFNSCGFYETVILFKTDKYNYKIKYPKNLNIFIGSMDSTRYELDENIYDNNFLDTIAIINNIEIFLLDKNSILYKTWISDLKSGKVNFVYRIENFSNLKCKKLNISYGIFEELYKENINKNSLIELFIDVGENKILVFTFDNKNNKKLEKEIYKIINSLTREKINNK